MVGTESEEICESDQLYDGLRVGIEFPIRTVQSIWNVKEDNEE